MIKTSLLKLECPFVAFLKAYTGTTDKNEQFDIIKDALIGEDDCNPTDYELQKYMNEDVLIHIYPLDCMGENYVELELMFGYDTKVCCTKFSCDCIDVKELLIDLYTASI